MVGLGAALALAQAGYAVTVLDRLAPPDWQPGPYRLRVLALNIATERWLDSLGAWTAIADRRVSPFRGIHAVDALGGGAVSFDAADLDAPHLGHIVENELVRSVLHEHARAAGVELVTPATPAAVRADAEVVRLELGDGHSLTARLLIGADGADSAVRRLAGIRARDRGYGQRAVVAAVETTTSHGEIARQRFLPGGPLAFLPLADGRSSIVWSLPAAEAAARLAEADADFLAELNAAAAGIAGEITAAGERAAFPLRRLHAARYIAPRVAVIGDAAHVVHPLAGQGANLGFRDAAMLTGLLAEARSRGRDPGAYGLLRRYERTRRGDNLRMQAALDAFHYVFRDQSESVARLRSLGFGLTDRLAPLKRRFMAEAAGLGRH